MSTDFKAAWVAINAYAKVVAIQSASLQAGFGVDQDDIQEAKSAKMAVQLELEKLHDPLIAQAAG